IPSLLQSPGSRNRDYFAPIRRKVPPKEFDERISSALDQTFTVRGGHARDTGNRVAGSVEMVCLQRTGLDVDADRDHRNCGGPTDLSTVERRPTMGRVVVLVYRSEEG